MRRLCCAGMAIAALAAGPAAATDLLTAYRQALAADAVYQAAKASAAADREEVPKALSALLPNLSYSGSSTRNNTTIESKVLGNVVTTRDQNYPSWSESWSLRQPVYRKQSFAAYAQAGAVSARADAAEEKERQGLGVRISEAYFEALLSLENERLVQVQKVSYERILELARLAFERGAGTRIDVLDIQSRRDQAVAAEIEASNTVRNNLRAIQAITRAPAQRLQPFDTSLRKLALSPIPLAQWEEVAEASSPEIETARQELVSAEQEVEKQRAGHYPTLDLVATRKRAVSETESTLNQHLQTDYFGVQLSVPIYSGGGVQASVRQALSRVEQARQKLEATRNDVLLRVNKEFANLEQSAQKSEALLLAVFSAEEAAKASAMGIVAGTRTAIDALNAQDQLLRARVDLAKARFLYVLSYVRLHANAGVLTEDKVEIANGWLER